MKLLELLDVEVNVGPVRALRGLSLYVDEGETVVLVGRNGAGKTSTLKTIMGIYQPINGKITYKGRDITNVPAHIRARQLGIGYSPEDSKVFPDLTVEENVKMGMWLSEKGKGIGGEAELEEAITRIFPELKKLWKKKGFYCSGGEKKMVSIARGLALSPSLLLLDEAFEGLAPIVVERFIKAVKEIKRLGVSLLITESNIYIAGKVAERLYVIDRGEIIYEGGPEEVLRRGDVMSVIRGY